MRCVTYAGETVITTDEVAEALVTLTASIAKHGDAEAVRIPIIVEGTKDAGDADLVIGVGNDVLSAPIDWDGDVPDFSDAVARLQAHQLYPNRAGQAEPLDSEDQEDRSAYDWDLDAIDQP
ncbi:MAG: hypothetical protein ABW024_04020 [Microbacterium sp.]